MSFRFSLLALALVFVVACEGPVARRGVDRSPVATFESVYRDFRAYYGLFEVKGVDWDAVYALHRSSVREDTTDAELHAVLVAMLSTLDDAHVTLYPATRTDLPVWSVDLVDGVYVEPPFDEELVRTRYLVDARSPHPDITYGHLADGIGYLHIGSFDGSVKQYEGPMDAALGALADAPALVLDIRDNPGGFDPLAQYVAGRFADARRLYMTVRKRSGPELGDFTAPIDWYVEPTGESRFTRPIVVLTSYQTESAGETFLLAMRTMPHVTHFGQTTGGALSDNILREAGNGWAYTISVGDYRDAAGVSYEGMGIVPAVESVGSYDAIRAGIDTVLEQADAHLAARVLN